MWQPVLFLKNLAPWQICQSEMENTLTSFGIYWKQLIYVIIMMTSCLLFEFGGGSSMSVRIILPMRAIVPLRGLFSQCSEWTSSKRCSLSPWVHFTRPPFFFLSIFIFIFSYCVFPYRTFLFTDFRSSAWTIELSSDWDGKFWGMQESEDVNANCIM